MPSWVIPVLERGVTVTEVGEFIDRIVAGAQIPSRTQREDLRRELWTHFEDAGFSPQGLRTALHRFGPEALVADRLRRAYRRDYLFFYFAKIAASVVASMAVALLIQVLVNLRLEVQAEVFRLAPGFSRAAGLSVGVVLGLVTAWEVGRRPFNRSRAALAVCSYLVVCIAVELFMTSSMGGMITATELVVLGCACSRLELRLARLPLTFGAFAAALYVTHLMISVAFGPTRAMAASAILVAVWVSTVLILTRFDHEFVRWFEAPKSVPR